MGIPRKTNLAGHQAQTLTNQTLLLALAPVSRPLHHLDRPAHLIHLAALYPQTCHNVTPSSLSLVSLDCTTSNVPLTGTIKFVLKYSPQAQVPTPPSCSIPELASAPFEPMGGDISLTTMFQCVKLTFGTS